MNQYNYAIKLLKDAPKRAKVFVPNCNRLHTIEIFLFLCGLKDSFPAFDDGAITIVGIDESAWCVPSVYRKNFCPPNHLCIIREKNED